MTKQTPRMSKNLKGCLWKQTTQKRTKNRRLSFSNPSPAEPGYALPLQAV